MSDTKSLVLGSDADRRRVVQRLARLDLSRRQARGSRRPVGGRRLRSTAAGRARSHSPPGERPRSSRLTRRAA